MCTDIVNRQTKCIVYSIARHSVLSERHKGSVDTTQLPINIEVSMHTSVFGLGFEVPGKDCNSINGSKVYFGV